MGTLQTNNKNQVSKHLLHMWQVELGRSELAYRALMGKGFAGSVSEVRFENLTPTMFPVQYAPRWDGSRLLFKNVERKRKGVHDWIREGPTEGS